MITEKENELPPRIWKILTMSGYRFDMEPVDHPNQHETEYLSIAEHNQLIREAKAKAWEEAARMTNDWSYTEESSRNFVFRMTEKAKQLREE